MRLRNSIVFITLLMYLTVLTVKAQDISEAVRLGDLAKVKEMVEQNPSLVTAKFEGSSTPLHIAARNGKLVIARYLVVKGADINAVSKYQGTPLDLAIESGDTKTIEFIRSVGGNPTRTDLETRKLTDNLLRISFPYGLRNNLVVFDGPDGIILIESGFGKRTVEVIRKTISDFSKRKICYVVNTHPHGDHTMGNTQLAPSVDAVIGLRRIKEGKLNSLFIKPENTLTGRNGLNFPEQYSMKFNGQEIIFIPYPGLHSNEDMLIYFPESKVLCLGDLLLSQNCPAISGNISDYFKFLDKVIDIFPEECIFISGHGRDLSYSGLIKYRKDMHEMTEKIRSEYPESGKAEELIKAGILDTYKAEYSFLDWLDPDSWIRAVCNDLKSGRL